MGRYVKRLSQILIVTFIILYALIWLLSPTIMRYAINTYGLPEPLFVTSTSSIRYNPFTAHLTIRDLEIKLDDQSSALKLKSLEAEVHLHQLLFDKIYVAAFTLDGIFIPVTVNASSLNVAGFELNSENSPPVAQEPEPKQANGFPYQVIIPEFSLTNAEIELQHFATKHRIALDSLSLQNILLSSDEQDIQFNLISHLNGAPIELALDGRLLKQQGQISVDVNAQNIALSAVRNFLPPEITAFDGKVSYTSKFDVAISSEQTLVNINELVLAIEDLYLEQGDIAISVKKQKLSTKNLATVMPTTDSSDKDAPVASNGNVASNTNVDSDSNAGRNTAHESEVNIAIEKEQTRVNINELLFSMDGLHVEQNAVVLDIQGQNIQAMNLAIVVSDNAPISITTNVDYNLAAISAISSLDQALLADISKLSINNAALKFEQNVAKANIKSVQAAKSEFSKNIQQKMPALAAYELLTVNDIEYSPTLIAVKDISLSGLVTHILLDKEKHISTLVAIPGAEDKTSPATATEQESTQAVVAKTGQDKVLEPVPETKTKTATANEAEKITFKLAKFSLADAAQINFKDRSVTPNYVRNFSINNLSLVDIDTSKPEQQVLLSMQGNSDKYANFELKGNGLPFAETQKFNLNAMVKELSLPGVSSYIKDALKYEIESGQLDLNVTADLNGNKLNGDVDLLLRGVEFITANDPERGAVKSTFSVPFNVALGMLKDSDGNVELSLPLAGDTSAPSFGLSGLLTLLVKQATMSAAKDYLITTFVPYASVMKVAMAAGEYALKLRINDLPYADTEVALNAEQLEFSRQMSVMLADRGNVNIKLCAIATARDIDLTDASQALEPENIARLTAISQQRVEVFKAHMVDELKVPSARLLFCTPQIDTSKDAKARIKFVI